MKNFKKILVCMMAVATLGSVSLMPMNANALITIDNSPEIYYEKLKWYEENAISGDAILLIEDEDTSYPSKYYLHGGGIIDAIDDTFDISKIENIVTIIPENFEIIIDYDNIYYMASYSYTNHEWTRYPDIGIKKIIGESENKPITEFTVGDSTFPRGDINLDGKVNTVDLLMLKKYLLGLMEW